MVECSFQTSGHVTSLPADPQIGAKGGAQVQPTDYSGGLLNVKDAGQLYVRRHSWDSRKTAQQKTMPNIKIWLVFLLTDSACRLFVFFVSLQIIRAIKKKKVDFGFL